MFLWKFSLDMGLPTMHSCSSFFVKANTLGEAVKIAGQWLKTVGVDDFHIVNVARTEDSSPIVN